MEAKTELAELLGEMKETAEEAHGLTDELAGDCVKAIELLEALEEKGAAEMAVVDEQAGGG